MARANNIFATNLTSNNPSRAMLLDWVNSSLKAKFTKIEELCTGAAYCQWMDMLYPNSTNLQRVKFWTNVEYEFIENFKILQAAFKKLSVTRSVPMEKLAKGKITDNMEFLQWFKRFFDANFREECKDYDALAVRKGAPMGYGSGGARRTPPAGKKSAAPEAKITRANTTFLADKTSRTNPTVLTRSNTTLLDDRTKSATPGSTPPIPIFPMMLTRSNTEILEDRVPRVDSVDELEAKELSSKLLESTVPVETEQEQGIVVVKPQVEEQKSDTPEEQQPEELVPVVPEKHLLTVEHLPVERSATKSEESREQKYNGRVDPEEIEETGSTSAHTTYIARANNIFATNLTSNNPSRAMLLDWVNSSLKAKFTKIEELCTGAAYCQWMDMLFPNSTNLQRVKFWTNVEYEFIENFKILQAAFKKMSVTRNVPMEKLAKGRITDNMEFLQWFKRFFDANFREECNNYDALAVRKGAPMGYGSGGARRTPPAGKKSAAPKAKKITRANTTFLADKTSRTNPTVLTRSNTTLLDDRTKSATPGSTPPIPVIPMALTRSNTEILEDRVPRVDSVDELEAKELSSKLVESTVPVDTEQEPGILVVKPQVGDQKSATPEEQQPEELVPVVPEEHLLAIEHLPMERPAAESEESRAQEDESTDNGRVDSEQIDRSRTISQLPDMRNFQNMTREELLLCLQASISETHYYHQKCAKLEEMCDDPEGTIENKDVLDILYD